MRNYLRTTALVVGLMASVVLGAYIYWSYVEAARTDTGGSGTTSQAQMRVDEGPGASVATATPIESIFVHRATRGSTSANSTYLNNRLINGNPDAVLSVTQNWNPRGVGGTYNDHPVGVWYDATAKRWAIFNQDRSAMPEGAAFNVVVAAPTGTR